MSPDLIVSFSIHGNESYNKIPILTIKSASSSDSSAALIMSTKKIKLNTKNRGKEILVKKGNYLRFFITATYHPMRSSDHK
ncbi:hypothetical protein DK846_02980 [Methanospirillum lacunae]|uniref:Uncharacterized protein n=1 Tax=Methanospirillum lacunae TaxID=668570 RepID=A0A2V2N6L3_9EURY|nr:hypothetical protein DK846_02980 [Methanospirillum lacunae]